MEILCGALRGCAPHFLKGPISDFEVPSPLCGRCSIYWRDNVMLFGLILDIVAFAWAIISGAGLFFVLVTGAIAIVLIFATYYVSRYAELKEMDVQLKNLQTISNGFQTDLNNLRNVDKLVGLAETRLNAINEQIISRQKLLELTIKEETETRNGINREVGHLQTIRGHLDNSVKNLDVRLGASVGKLEGVAVQITSALN